MAATRWLLPTPGGPKTRTLAPFSSQASPSASAMTCAFETVGTAAKSKLAELLSGRQWRLQPMPLDPPRLALGQLVLQQHAEEALGRPALLVGLLGELRPQPPDRRQAQLGQHDRQPRRIGRVALVAGTHAASSSSSYCAGAATRTLTVGMRVGRGANPRAARSMSGNSPRIEQRARALRQLGLDAVARGQVEQVRP